MIGSTQPLHEAFDHGLYVRYEVGLIVFVVRIKEAPPFKGEGVKICRRWIDLQELIEDRAKFVGGVVMIVSREEEIE